MKQGFSVVDTDLHVMEPRDLWRSRLPEKYRSAVEITYPDERGIAEFSGIHIRVGDVSWQLIPGGKYGMQRQWYAKFKEQPLLGVMHSDGGGTPANTLKGMEIEGIDLAVIVPTVLFTVTTADGLDPELVTVLCQTYNDYVAEFCQADPERLKFWGWLPRQDPERAAKEARRCVEELGAVGVALTTGNVDGWNLSEPFFDPLWPTLEELDVPLGLHLYGVAPKLHADPVMRYMDRPRTAIVSAVLQGSNQAMSAVAELCCGGVLERHPGLKPMVMETASTWLIWLLQRMDDQWEIYREVIDDIDLSLKPSEYFRRQCTIAVECDENHLDYLANACDLADNLVFTTDFPHHDSNFPHAVDEFLELGLPEDLTRKILADNAQRIFNLTPVPA
jgi:predicted TIM-barrel fold metal-dependent hydrolase